MAHGSCPSARSLIIHGATYCCGSHCVWLATLSQWVTHTITRSHAVSYSCSCEIALVGNNSSMTHLPPPPPPAASTPRESHDCMLYSLILSTYIDLCCPIIIGLLVATCYIHAVKSGWANGDRVLYMLSIWVELMATACYTCYQFGLS
jgi:hypothetical protein